MLVLSTELHLNTLYLFQTTLSIHPSSNTPSQLTLPLLTHLFNIISLTRLSVANEGINITTVTTLPALLMVINPPLRLLQVHDNRFIPHNNNNNDNNNNNNNNDNNNNNNNNNNPPIPLLLHSISSLFCTSTPHSVPSLLSQHVSNHNSMSVKKALVDQD